MLLRHCECCGLAASGANTTCDPANPDDELNAAAVDAVSARRRSVGDRMYIFLGEVMNLLDVLLLNDKDESVLSNVQVEF